jgi:glycosyltransferase involved in cell wall biosynthesis
MHSGTFSNKRFLIVHFRVGRTDGVSLEIDSWKNILEENGAEVALCGGPFSIGADYVIENLEQQLNPQVRKIDEDSFGGLKNLGSEKDLKGAITEEQKKLSRDFEKVIEDFHPSNIIISNVFSVGEGIHAAGAIAEVLDKYEIPTALVGHDFYWENVRYKKPSFSFIESMLKNYFPLKRDYVCNYCINRIAQKELKDKKNIHADVLYDTFNYRQRNWKKKKRITDYLRKKGIKKNSLFVLQATRIVRRKNIEIAMDFVKELEERKEELDGILYDGRKFDSGKDEIVLVLSGYAEKRDEKYLASLLKYGKDLGVNVVYLGDDLHDKYGLFDIYPYADLITYPSEYEGFGNQLLEAVFAKRPVVLFEYPVYKMDIKDKKFNFLSLGDQKDVDGENGFAKISMEKMDMVVTDAVDLLKDSGKYCSICDQNFNIASNHFSFDRTLDVFRESFR